MGSLPPIDSFGGVWFKRVHAVVSCIWRRVGVGGYGLQPTSYFAVDKAGTYVVSLTVNDGTVNSSPDTVNISTINVAPVADAGSDQTVPEESTVTLDGSGSSDADGNTLTYSWAFTSKPSNSTATLNDATMVNPTFTADEEGTYVVSLIVNDGTVNSSPDTVTITAEDDVSEVIEA